MAATIGREMLEVVSGLESTGVGVDAKELAAEEASLTKVRDYIDRNELEPEFFKEMAEDSRRNGTDQITLEEINAVIRATRADRAARIAKRR